MRRSLELQVWRRAQSICEYCCMPQTYYRARFQVDHIIARQHNGPTAADNLALACFHCNTHKGTNIAGIDPASSELVRLFHPRRDAWSEHFQWIGARLVGLTPEGRATVQVLDLNDREYLRTREELIAEGVFPARVGSEP